MLTENAINLLNSVMYVGCNILKLFPYVWDPKKFRLSPAPISHILVFNFHRLYQHSLAIFVVYRLLSASNWDSIPDRQRVLHAVWIAAHTFTLVCFIQFQKTQHEIMHFTNALWRYILCHRGETAENNYLSICVMIGGVLIYINGPAHGTGMIEVPCTPHFISSLSFACKDPTEDVENLITKVPFILFETYYVTLALYQFGFFWVIIFLGLAWIRAELDIVKNLLSDTDEKRMEIGILHYKTCFRINSYLNDSFKFYLEWFPTCLLGLTSLLLFATIKLWYIPIHAYLLFPACAMRCFFEAMTPLAMAGKVNEESTAILSQFAKKMKSVQAGNSQNYKWLRATQRSYQTVVCKAGNLYTFENSIVLCTLNNTVQLTMNLLLMSKKGAGKSLAESLT